MFWLELMFCSRFELEHTLVLKAQCAILKGRKSSPKSIWNFNSVSSFMNGCLFIRQLIEKRNYYFNEIQGTQERSERKDTKTFYGYRRLREQSCLTTEIIIFIKQLVIIYLHMYTYINRKNRQKWLCGFCWWLENRIAFRGKVKSFYNLADLSLNYGNVKNSLALKL